MKNQADELYRLRQDFVLKPFPFVAKISQVYPNGFDMRVEDQIIYFTSDKMRLNPAAVLVSENVIKRAVTGIAVVFHERQVSIGQQCLRRGPDIETGWNRSFVDNDFTRNNLQAISKCLKLFGRKSMVNNLFTGSSHVTDKLMNNRDHILQWPTNLKTIKAFIGQGEGLTPAFDDFIAGVSFADCFFNLCHINLPQNFLADIAMQTTAQSSQQLGFCFMGKLNIAFEQLLAALCHRKLKPAEIIRTMNYGHSSGTDILHGISHHLANFLGFSKEYKPEHQPLRFQPALE